MNGPLEVKTVHGRAALHEIRSEWNDLVEASSGLPFMRQEWLDLWLESFAPHGAFLALTVRRAGRLVLGLPVLRRRDPFLGLPLRRLRSPTNDHSFQFELLLRPGEEACVEGFLQALTTTAGPWDLLELQETVVDSRGVHALIQAAERAGHLCGVWHAYRSPYLALEGDWTAFQSSLKAKFRSNLRNRFKRLGRLGPVRLETHEGGAITQGLLQRCFEIERRGWKGTEGSAIACDPTLVGFYTAWLLEAARRGFARVFLLRVGEGTAAFDLSIDLGGRRYCLKIGYDPEYSTYSPGQLLNSLILEDCHRRGIRNYEFLGVATPAKLDWGPALRHHAWIFVYNHGLRSRAHHAWKFVLKERLRALMRS